MRRDCLIFVFLALAPAVTAGGELPFLAHKQAAAASVDAHAGELVALADQVWEYAETALHERRSAALLADDLEARGFEIERGVAGLPTAFVASYGAGRPILGLLGEYDALPGISQQAVAERAPRVEGGAGQGCGHNLLGVGALGAALAVQERIAAGELAGTIRFYGTPAEESVGGKVYMARAGLFDDLDAVLTWHPDLATRADTKSSQAMIDLRVEFTGRAAHAAADPWNGRSAADAAELFTYALNLMREHVKPTVRMHYTLQEAGDVPNVVPEHARLWVWVRDSRMAGAEELLARVTKIVEGAALATETEGELTIQAGSWEMLESRLAGRRLHANLEWLGPLAYTPEEEAFAAALQQAAGVPQAGIAGALEPFVEHPGDPDGGSTDVADVSWLVPTVHLSVTTAPAGVPWHAWPTVAASRTSIGHKGMLLAAKALAATAIDLMADPEILPAMRAELEERRGDKTWKPWVPVGPPPVPTAEEGTARADIVLTGGAVYTVDAVRSWAQAVAIDGGRIVYVGSSAGAREWIDEGTEVIDLAGRMLLPGFQDAHVHPLSAGVELGQCDLNSAESAAEVLDRVRGCAADVEPGEWLIGGGWQLPLFPEANPHRRDLDAIRADLPILLWAADGHSGWANTKALEIAAITAATPDPRTGRIERDADGSPSGTLRESAVDLVAEHVPETTAEESAAGLARARDALLPLGITAVQDASVSATGLEAYRAAQERGEFPLRVVAALYVDPEQGPEQVDDLVALRERLAGPRLHPTHAKLFLDGVIEARTAYMLEPYTDKPGDRGTPEWPDERLFPVVEKLAAAGFSIHGHAIGDGAVRQGLDALERARAVNPDPALRHQLGHIEVIHPDDQQRFRRLQVVANFQALWAYADSYIVDLTWPGIGPERSAWIYPIGSVSRAGAPLALGSDWSVSSSNPLEIMEVAITRRDPKASPGDPGEPMQPEERIDLPAALAAATIGAAWANGLEDDTGSIEVGKAADLVVLSENLFEIDPAALSDVAVDLTLIEGEVVYRRAAP